MSANASAILINPISSANNQANYKLIKSQNCECCGSLYNLMSTTINDFVNSSNYYNHRSHRRNNHHRPPHHHYNDTLIDASFLLHTRSKELDSFEETIFQGSLSKLRFNNNTCFVKSSDEESSGDDELDNCKPRHLIRSTSLKTQESASRVSKSKKGKKMVRFADALGLEFEYIKLISQDEIPSVPISAFSDLKLCNTTYPLSRCGESNKEEEDEERSLKDRDNKEEEEDEFDPKPIISRTASNHNQHMMVLQFVQPFQSVTFYERLRAQKVSLESCEISTGAGNLSVTCIIRVLNTSFVKQVTVRHTMTEWKGWNDSLASYLPNSCDGWSDKFIVTFSIRSSTPKGSLVSGQRVLFAIRYIVNNEEYWDNNMGSNYALLYR